MNYTKKALSILSKYNNEYLDNLRLELKKIAPLNKKYLVFNGGGIKGICFLGVLQCLIDTNNIENIYTFIGSSISSLLLFLYLIGYSPKDLLYFVLNYNFKDLQEINIDQLFINYGLNDGKIIQIILTKFIKSKHIDENITFNELYNLNKKLFIITGTNLTKKKCEYFSFLTTPNMKLLDAIRISVSIPFYFKPYIYNNCYYIDGSCMNDLAINCLYLDPFINFISENENYDDIKNKILSVYLDDTNNNFNNVFQYAFSVLYILEQNNINFKDISLIIDTKNIKSFDFTINKKTKQELYNIGYANMFDAINKIK